jgi:hypothetical protein
MTRAVLLSHITVTPFFDHMLFQKSRNKRADELLNIFWHLVQIFVIFCNDISVTAKNIAI